MAPVILVTFAGRQKRMEILNRYIRKAIADGIIDEWHVWDFTRNAEDHAWVTREFGPVRFMGAEVPYQACGSFSQRAAFRIDVDIPRDLHLAILPDAEPDAFYEVVVGGWGNTMSVVRKYPREALQTFDRKNEDARWLRQTPGVLSPGRVNEVTLSVDDAGITTLSANGVPVGRWPDMNTAGGATVMIRGGWGASLELPGTNAPIRRYIGDPGTTVPYWQAFDYYAKRLKTFEDSLFLKCDDDIVYMELEKLSAFIEFRRAQRNYFIVSANVVNNGVCAYLQQSAGSLPEELGVFEYPPGGFGGTLWQSPDRARELHEFFLRNEARPLPFAGPVVEWGERQSINFIAWLGRDIAHMSMPRGDDELALSVSIPTYLNRPNAIYSGFTVSHLSFGPQERGLDVQPLIDAYEALMHTKLA